tara:strand:+ start:5133 stop:5315 length:183 start_codon:yes stop_codon:yes gene_type:complete
MIPQIPGYDYSVSFQFDYSNIERKPVKFIETIQLDNQKILESNDTTSILRDPKEFDIKPF